MGLMSEVYKIGLDNNDKPINGNINIWCGNKSQMHNKFRSIQLANICFQLQPI